MRIGRARLIKLTTDDDLVEMKEGIPLGKVYDVDLDSIQKIRAYNTVRKVVHVRDWIRVAPPDNGLLALELLEIIE